MSLKKIIIALTIFTGLFAVSAYAADLSAEVSTSYFGNIFFDGYEKFFDVTITNKSEEQMSLELEYHILDSISGEEVFADNKKIAVAALETHKEKYSLSAELAYSVYTVRVVGKHNGTELFRTETPFSICMRVPKSKVSSKMGINAHLNWGNGRNIPEELNVINNIGIANIREGYSWASFEQTKGKYTQTQACADYLNNAKLYGTDVLVMAGFSNNLYSANTNTFPRTETERNAFAEYVYNMLAKNDNSNTIKCVEIWNEPDFSSRYATPEEYAYLLKTVYQRVKQDFPNVKIGAPALAKTLGGDDVSGQAWLTAFLNTDFDDDGKFDTYKYFDVVCLHQYDKRYNVVVEQMRNVKDILNTYKCSDKEIYQTEFGNSRFTENKLEGEDIQAQRLARYYLTMIADNVSDRYYIYDFSNDGTDTSNKEYTFGLCQSHLEDIPCAAKPGLLAVSAMNYFTSGMTKVDNSLSQGYRKVIRMSNGMGNELYALFLNYTDEQGQIMNTAYTEDYEFVTDKPYVKFFDYLGNRIYPAITQGGYCIKIGNAPIYAMTCDAEQGQAELEYVNAQRYGKSVHVTGKITNSENGKKVGIKVFDEEHNLVYVDQLATADEKFEFDFCPGEDGIFIINIGAEGLGKIATWQFEYNSVYAAITRVFNNSDEVVTFAEYNNNGTKDLRVKVEDRLCERFTIIVGYFNNDRLIKTEVINSENMTSEDGIYHYTLNDTMPGGANSVRIMTIDGVENLTPLCCYKIFD